MTRLAMCLLIVLTMPSALYSQSSPPLTENERRLVMEYLIELKHARETIKALQDDKAREAERDLRDAESWQRVVDAEKKMTSAAEKERDLALKERDLQAEKAKMYEDLYRILAKKRGGVGCFFKKVFTLGLSACGG